MRRPVLIHGRLADAPPEGPARPQLTTPASRPVTLIAAEECDRSGADASVLDVTGNASNVQTVILL